MRHLLSVRGIRKLTLVMVACIPALLLTPGDSAARDGDRLRLIAGVDATLDAFLENGEAARAVRDALAKARGVLVFTGAGTGGGGRQGLLFGRNASGAWTGPAVYTVVSGTLGRSPTDEIGRVLFIVLTDVERLIATRVHLGGSGVSIARLPQDALPTTDLAAVTDAADGGADPLVVFTGTVLAPDTDATNALYGKRITTRDAVASTADLGDDIVILRRRLDAVTGMP